MTETALQGRRLHLLVAQKIRHVLGGSLAGIVAGEVVRGHVDVIDALRGGRACGHGQVRQIAHLTARNGLERNARSGRSLDPPELSSVDRGVDLRSVTGIDTVGLAGVPLLVPYFQ